MSAGVLLHQTWRDLDPPPQFEAYRATWLQHNARLGRVLYDDVACRQGVQAHAPHLLATYDALPAHIMRVDMVRYVWMLHLGGIYADLDVECTGPVDALLAPGVHLVLEDIRPGRPTIGNALMSSTPGHPFWAHVLAELEVRARCLRHYASESAKAKRHAVLWATGPYLLTDVLAVTVATSMDALGVTVHQQGSVGAIHHRAGTWWR